MTIRLMIGLLMASGLALMPGCDSHTTIKSWEECKMACEETKGKVTHVSTISYGCTCSNGKRSWSIQP